MSERDDKTPEQYLNGGSEISRLYRQAAREEPPAALNDALLAAANREVAAKPKRAYLPRSWYLPVSIAAVLVVGVTVTLLMVERGEEPFVPAVPKIVPQSDAPASQPSSQAAPEARRAQPPQEAARPATAEKKPAPAQQEIGKTKPAAEPKPFTGEAAAPAAAGAAADLSTQSGATGGAGAARQATEAAPSVAPAPVSPAKPMLRDERAAGRPAMKSMDAGEKSEKVLAPEKWLEQIAELRRQGKIAEAEASLAEFKKRYPGYPVPGERN